MAIRHNVDAELQLVDGDGNVVDSIKYSDILEMCKKFKYLEDEVFELKRKVRYLEREARK